MERKRKWWLWLIIAFACMITAFALAELTGTSIGSVFGWGLFGVLGLVVLVLGLALTGLFIVVPSAAIIRWLVAAFISNREIRYITLGSLGFSSIMAGWILTTRQAGWSLIVVMVGFALGCLTGVEYEQHSLSSSNESARRLEQVSGTDNRRDV